MAIEKMKMMNVAFLKKDSHNVFQEIVLDGSVHITNASNTSNFTLKYLNSQMEQIHQMGIDTTKIRTFKSDKFFEKKKYKDIIDQIMTYFDIDYNDIEFSKIRDLSYNERLKFLDKILSETLNLKNKEEANRYARSRTRMLINSIEYFKDMDIKASAFKSLKHIRVDIGEISKSAWLNLKENYENVKAAVIHLGSNNYGEKVMIFSPKCLEDQTIPLLKSLSFDTIELPTANITFSEIIKIKSKELLDLENEQEKIIKEKEAFKQTYKEEVLSSLYRFRVIEKIEEVENHSAMSENFALFSGFVPESRAEHLKNIIEKVAPYSVISFNDDIEISQEIKIPTKLKNIPLLSPFESLVKMYSIPNYNETDPTPFFAITYMLLFGMMFGDVGQGLVFVILGLFLAPKLGSLAKIVQRLGFSSVIFGFLYGSVFGMETLIPALVIRPMEEINQILIVSIVLGVILIFISYFIGFINLKRNKEYTKLYFDKNGIAGFLFYIGFLLLLINIAALGNKVSPQVSSFLTVLSVAVMIITSSLMFFKPKLAKKVEPNIKHHEEFSPVESGFELFETIMGFFSNTLSFIRVGAFAINHVGLFMAFHALGQMIGTSLGNVLMIVLGNLVILVLEGLIVFIQAIRLEYYELFSKYFKGEGIIYEPLKVDFKN